MAYPTSLDSFSANVDNVDVIYASDVNELQTAITSLEAKIGVDSSAVTTSHDYKLGEILTTDKAVGKTATQTVANKTLGTGTKVAIGSDADKDMYYRASDGTLTRIPVGTDNQILKLNGTTPGWEAETTTVNASTTVAGITELATSAEITAGTATGGTGAALVVTPDALASSTPVFNGSGLTNLTNPAVYASGSTTYDLTTASGTQNIAHGLAKTPKYIKITYYVAFSNVSSQSAPTRYGVGVFNGSTYTNWFTGSKSSETSNTYQSSYISASSIIEYQNGGGGSSSSQVATASLNSTNIVLSWTKTGTPTGTLTIIWEAYA